MFTGLIQGIAETVAVEDRATGRGLWVRIPVSLFEGESVALNGVCCTVCGPLPEGEAPYRFDLLQETCDKTSLRAVYPGDPVNYERCVTPSTLLGGHLLQGHVDTTGEVCAVTALGEGTYAVEIAYPDAFFPLLVPKGSVAIDGISLTVVSVEKTRFSVHIIPHTWANTVLHTRAVGALVNLEFDVVGKYLYHFYQIQHGNDWA